MAYVIAQLSDVHIGGPNPGSSERFSQAIDEINAMTHRQISSSSRRPHPPGRAERMVRVPDASRTPGAMERNTWKPRSQDRGFRWPQVGRPWTLHVVLVDSSSTISPPTTRPGLSSSQPAWRNSYGDRIHHPPFETGIWWMDCVGLRGADLFEAVVRRHPQVRHVMSGHVHRPIATNWAGCAVTVCPSTSVAVAGDLDPAHDPAETNEPPMLSLHAYVGDTVVTHVVAVGSAATRSSITATAPDFVTWARGQQAQRPSVFSTAG